MKMLRLIMMNLVLLIMVFAFTAPAHAVLVDNLDGTITQIRDDGITLMWLTDANYGEMNWDDAMASVEALDFAGYDDWRLPSSMNPDESGPCFDTGCTESEMGYLFYTELETTPYYTGCVIGVNCGITDPGPFVDFQSNDYWSSTVLDEDNSWYFNFLRGQQKTLDTDIGLYVTAVRTVAIVPEPLSSALFVIGSVTLGIRRFRKRK